MLYDNITDAAAYLRTKTALVPTVGLILGSGLGALADAIEDPVEVPYSEIPHFPRSNVVGHKGSLVLGTLRGCPVAVMQGRYHYYEGHGAQAITFPIYVLGRLGVKTLIVTNACGGIRPDFRPGDLMLITDYINLLGINPLIGDNDDRLGPRFPDMTEAFSKRLRALAEQAAQEIGLAVQSGVYALFNGPSFETAAEIRALSILGADAVGMSTVPETVVANYLGMEVLGLACITNMATGLAREKHSHAEVLRIANESGARLCRWVEAILSGLA